MAVTPDCLSGFRGFDSLQYRNLCLPLIASISNASGVIFPPTEMNSKKGANINKDNWLSGKAPDC